MPDAVETMFSYRQVPWHRKGKIVQEAPDSEQALVLSGLNWAVDQRPLYARVNGTLVKVPGHFANVRSTDGQVLGVVGSKYRVLQNREAFAFVDGLLGEGARYETAGSLFNGRRVWMLTRLPEVYKLAGDETETYLLVSNRHDGCGPVLAAVVPVRVVCQNTLNLALRRVMRSWRCRHTGNVNEKLTEARRTLGLVRDYMAELQAKAEVLRAMHLGPDAWNDMVAELLPLPENITRESTVERINERRKILRARMMAPDLAAHRWTAWAAVNAVAGFADRMEPIRKSANWEDNHVETVFDGHVLKDRAL